MKTSLKQNAEKEINRMQEVFDKIKVKDGKEYFAFAKTYFEDSKYFFGKKKYLEAFEAAVIAWSYIDFGLKLGWFKVPQEQKKWFTA